MIQNILDPNGDVIGTLELPDDTPDEVWAEKLALYSTPPAQPTMADIVKEKIVDATTFGQNLMRTFATENVLMGITQAGMTQPVTDYLHEMVHSLITGSLYMSIAVCDEILADTSDTKANLSPYVTDDRITAYKNTIQDYLGLPRT